MAFTPDTATEIDSYQGNPALAIGQSGNLPFFPTMSPEVVNQFTAITDAYVKKKQKDYDQWQTNLTKAKNETIGMEGVYQSDIPEIQKKQSELEALLAKDPTVVAVGAERNNPNYKKFIELEKDLLYSKRLSEHHAELDKEYKKLSAQKAFQNEAFKDQYEKFKASPITERSPFVPIMDDDDALQTNLQRILNMEEYKNPIQGTVTPETDVNGVATGATVITNPYSYETDRILPNLVQYNRDIDYYKYDNGLGLSDEEKAMTRDEYHLEQLKKRIPQGVLQGKMTRGTDLNTKLAENQRYWEKRDDINEQQAKEAEVRALENKKKADDTYPEVAKTITEVQDVFAIDPLKGKKINFPAPFAIENLYDITAEIKNNNPNFFNEVVAVTEVKNGLANKVYVQINPDKTKTFYLGSGEGIDKDSKLIYNATLNQAMKQRRLDKEYSKYLQEGGAQNSTQPTSKNQTQGSSSKGVFDMFYTPYGVTINNGVRRKGAMYNAQDAKDHNDHIHLQFDDPTEAKAIISLAKDWGLSTSGNPMADSNTHSKMTRDGKTSAHSTKFDDGTGKAVDIGHSLRNDYKGKETLEQLRLRFAKYLDDKYYGGGNSQSSNSATPSKTEVIGTLKGAKGKTLKIVK